jgi:hypothetical protein
MSQIPVSITFDQSYSNKIRVIQESISDPTTHRKVLEGLVDTGYANALKTLHSAGMISDSVLKMGIKQLPKFLHPYFDN